MTRKPKPDPLAPVFRLHPKPWRAMSIVPKSKSWFVCDANDNFVILFALPEQIARAIAKLGGK